MRVAYVGNFGSEYSTENDVRLAFEAEGHEVVALQENIVKYSEVRRQALVSDLLLWTGTWDAAQPLDESITTFKLCADAGVPTATYHLDTFWPIARGGRQWWLAPMFYTGTIFTADGCYPERWDALGKRHVWLPAVVRHTVCDDVAAGRFARRARYRCDVAFTGASMKTYHDEWPYRGDLLRSLKDMCRRRGWSFRNPGGSEPTITRPHMGDFYASAKVTVGDSLCPLRYDSLYWSDRVYETTGRRGLLIMPEIRALDLSDQFGKRLPQYAWGDWDELEEIVAGFLANDELRSQTAQQCYDVTRERHTYRNRVKTIIAEV